MDNNCSFDIESAVDGREFELRRRVGDNPQEKHPSPANAAGATLFTKEGFKTFTTSRTDIRVSMGESYQLRFSGVGDVVIHDIERQAASGGIASRN